MSDSLSSYAILVFAIAYRDPTISQRNKDQRAASQDQGSEKVVRHWQAYLPGDGRPSNAIYKARRPLAPPSCHRPAELVSRDGQ
jgi:hypothetical protein